MRKKKKEALLFFALSVLPVAAIVLLYFLDPQSGENKLASAIVLSVWAFGIIPAYVFCWRWLKTKTFMQGYYLGLIFGFLFFLLPLIFSPLLMVYYYVDALKG